jgi:hypothetical protein
MTVWSGDDVPRPLRHRRAGHVGWHAPRDRVNTAVSLLRGAMEPFRPQSTGMSPLPPASSGALELSGVRAPESSKAPFEGVYFVS